MNQPLFKLFGYYIYPLAIILLIVILLVAGVITFLTLKPKKEKAPKQVKEKMKNDPKPKKKTKEKPVKAKKEPRPKRKSRTKKQEDNVIDEESAETEELTDYEKMILGYETERSPEVDNLVDAINQEEVVDEEDLQTIDPIEVVIPEDDEPVQESSQGKRRRRRKGTAVVVPEPEPEVVVEEPVKVEKDVGYVLYDEELDISFTPNKVTKWQRENLLKLIDESIELYLEETTGSVDYYNWLVMLKTYVEKQEYWDVESIEAKNPKTVTCLNFLIAEELLYDLDENNLSKVSLWLSTLDAVNGGFENKFMSSWYDEDLTPTMVNDKMTEEEGYIATLLTGAIHFATQNINKETDAIDPDDDYATRTLLSYMTSDFSKFIYEFDETKNFFDLSVDVKMFYMHCLGYYIQREIEKTDSTPFETILDANLLSHVRAMTAINEGLPYALFLTEVSEEMED